jgi:hypothetical protein
MTLCVACSAKTNKEAGGAGGGWAGSTWLYGSSLNGVVRVRRTSRVAVHDPQKEVYTLKELEKLGTKAGVGVFPLLVALPPLAPLPVPGMTHATSPPNAPQRPPTPPTPVCSHPNHQGRGAEPGG